MSRMPVSMTCSLHVSSSDLGDYDKWCICSTKRQIKNVCSWQQTKCPQDWKIKKSKSVLIEKHSPHVPIFSFFSIFYLFLSSLSFFFPPFCFITGQRKLHLEKQCLSLLKAIHVWLFISSLFRLENMMNLTKNSCFFFIFFCAVVFIIITMHRWLIGVLKHMCSTENLSNFLCCSLFELMHHFLLFFHRPCLSLMLSKDNLQVFRAYCLYSSNAIYHLVKVHHVTWLIPIEVTFSP